MPRTPVVSSFVKTRRGGSSGSSGLLNLLLLFLTVNAKDWLLTQKL